MSQSPTLLAHRLGQVGVILGLLPWLLIVPLGVYGMDFMLWTWIWPALLGAGGVSAGLLALRLRTPPARRLAWAAVLLGAVAFLAAVAGFLGMLASMRQMMPGMEM